MQQQGQILSNMKKSSTYSKHYTVFAKHLMQMDVIIIVSAIVKETSVSYANSANTFIRIEQIERY